MVERYILLDYKKPTRNKTTFLFLQMLVDLCLAHWSDVVDGSRNIQEIVMNIETYEPK